MLDALRSLQKSIAQMRAQSQLPESSLADDPHINTFFRFVDAIHEVANARRIMDSGHFLMITRHDASTGSVDPENFHLSPLKESLQHIQERYGRLDLDRRDDRGDIPVSVDRIISMVKWLMLKNHAIDYLMTFEVTRVPNSNDFMVKVPKWDGSRAIPETERQERLLEAEAFLTACCHPGRLGVFPAATVQVHHG